MVERLPEATGLFSENPRTGVGGILSHQPLASKAPKAPRTPQAIATAVHGVPELDSKALLKTHGTT